MTHVLNLFSTSLSDNVNFYEASTALLLQLSYLKILRLTVYIFIYKEKKMVKSAK